MLKGLFSKENLNVKEVKKVKMILVFVCAVFLVFGLINDVNATVTYGVGPGSFSLATVETFSNPFVSTNNYDFGNGMELTSTQAQYINYTFDYGMGNEPEVDGGIDGLGTGYLGTLLTPTTFSFIFSSGIDLFGFYGAESSVTPPSTGRDGILDINFFDMSNNFLTSFAINTKGVHAWSQFHGFSSTSLIGRVEFDVVGHSVYDNVSFDVQQVPEPATLLLLGSGLVGLGVFRNKFRKK